MTEVRSLTGWMPLLSLSHQSTEGNYTESFWTSCFCVTGQISRDYSRLGQIPQRQTFGTA